MTTAPIALFIFNRPEHLRKTLASLAACDGFDGAPVLVFGDGPRNEGDRGQVEAARAVAREVLGKHGRYVFSPTNKGLSRSVIDGVTAVLEEFDRVVVVEDDLEIAPDFLTFMNAALDRYENDEQVFQISGHAFNAPELVKSARAAFMPFISTWGWGTWRRAWAHMDEAAIGWEALNSNASLRRRFNLDGVYDYATMMTRQMAGKRDSWGIRWYWSVFRKDGLVLYPPRSLVRNNGFDGTGSHGRGTFRRYGDRHPPVRGAGIELPPPILDDKSFAATRQEIRRRNGGRVGQIVDTAKRLLSVAAGR